jgi:hypothetical protein
MRGDAAAELVACLSTLTHAAAAAALQRREQEQAAGARPPLRRLAPWTSDDTVHSLREHVPFDN